MLNTAVRHSIHLPLRHSISSVFRTSVDVRQMNTYETRHRNRLNGGNYGLGTTRNATATAIKRSLLLSVLSVETL